MNKKIAVLMTVYNRKDKTLTCLSTLFKCILPEKYELNVFLVNDGCTDGTEKAIADNFPQITVIQGNGNLFWNRGMRLAWETAAKTFDFDYYIWLNDDVILYENSIFGLLQCAENQNNTAIICGSTCSINDKNEITYGGRIKRYGILTPNGEMQKCDCFNGQLALIPRFVFRKMGMNDKAFHHSFGDFDYGFRAKKAGIEIFVAPDISGECNVNSNDSFPAWRNPKVPFLQRLKVLYSPLGKNPIELFRYTYRHKSLLTACISLCSIHFIVCFPQKNKIKSMKFVSIAGGLGNQMFVGAFCLELQKRGQKTLLFVPYKNNSKKYGHQGYELKKVFDYNQKLNFASKIKYQFLTLYVNLLRLFPKKLRTVLSKTIGIFEVKVAENFIFYPEVFDFKHKNELFKGTWQSEKFFENAKDEVRQKFIFNEKLLSEKTLEIRQLIEQSNSVSIHIRRGDYFSAQYVNGFANICTLDYYNNAVEKIKNEVKNAEFFIFTDDTDWVTENFKLENSHFITHNSGGNSWQDMYLISRCKHNIIANSSFSWWGAWLNNNAEKIVIAPKKWWQTLEKDDVVPQNWRRI
ncbi:MAG: alpha-1,2-fucosyltransferase [Prevotellaceae bacterium]|jgi:GT2 family glycosyltransferase|nr:alpha-1,2-fucosyltransferase [Prevotellaceae bacterium]